MLKSQPRAVPHALDTRHRRDSIEHPERRGRASFRGRQTDWRRNTTPARHETRGFSWHSWSLREQFHGNPRQSTARRGRNGNSPTAFLGQEARRESRTIILRNRSQNPKRIALLKRSRHSMRRRKHTRNHRRRQLRNPMLGNRTPRRIAG